MSAPDPRVIEEFRRRKKAQIIATVPFVLVLIPIILRDRIHRTILGVPTCFVGPIFFAIVVGMLIFSFSNWRCPACNSYLGKSWFIRFCPRCGAGLAP